MQSGDNTMIWVAGGALVLYYLYSTGALGVVTTTAAAAPVTATPVFNPQTGQYVDPTTGLPVTQTASPYSGNQYINPQTGQAVNPITGQPYYANNNRNRSTTRTRGNVTPVLNPATGLYVYPGSITAANPAGIPYGSAQNQTMFGQFANRFNR